MNTTQALPPIERDEDMDRTYIPLLGGWEVQTKGKGSSFRIANTKTHERVLVLDKHLQPVIEQMAREIHEACKAALSDETVTLPDGWVAVPVELLKDITNCFDNVPSRAHVVNSIDENLKRIAQWVNSSDGGYGLYHSVNHYLQAAPTLNKKG